MTDNINQIRSTLLTQLQTYSQIENTTAYKAYGNALNEHQSDIVEILGGLDNLLQYCLSDNNFVSEKLDDDKLTKLQVLLGVSSDYDTKDTNIDI